MPSGGANKFTVDEVHEICEQHGFKMLDQEYVNNNTLMNVMCCCAREIKMRLADIKRGHRCKKCMALTNSQNFKTSDADISAFCQEKGCQLIKSWIQSKRTRIEYVCKCGRT